MVAQFVDVSDCYMADSNRKGKNMNREIGELRLAYLKKSIPPLLEC